MGIISGITNVVKKAVGMDQLKTQTQGIKKMAENLARPAKGSERVETFQEALVRLNLTEADIERRQQQFQRLTAIYTLIALVIFLYFIYLLIEKAFFPAIGCIGILLIIAAQYLRYKFWLYQMRERRLGCTLREFFSDMVGKKR